MTALDAPARRGQSRLPHRVSAGMESRVTTHDNDHQACGHRSGRRRLVHGSGRRSGRPAYARRSEHTRDAGSVRQRPGRFQQLHVRRIRSRRGRSRIEFRWWNRPGQRHLRAGTRPGRMRRQRRIGLLPHRQRRVTPTGRGTCSSRHDISPYAQLGACPSRLRLSAFPVRGATGRGSARPNQRCQTLVVASSRAIASSVLVGMSPRLPATTHGGAVRVHGRPRFRGLRLDAVIAPCTLIGTGSGGAARPTAYPNHVLEEVGRHRLRETR